MTTMSIETEGLVRSLMERQAEPLPKTFGQIILAEDEIVAGCILAQVTKMVSLGVEAPPVGIYLMLVDHDGQDDDGQDKYDGWAVVFYGSREDVTTWVRAQVEHLNRTYSGCDWCCGGGDELAAFYGAVCLALGMEYPQD